MPHALDNPPLVAALAMLIGVFAQVAARHINVPGIVLLLLAGLALGPDLANLVRPHALGAGLEGIVGLAVAVILFEGGLNLNLRVLRRQQLPIQRLVLMGSLLTALGGASFAHLLLSWDWRRALLFGTLVIVTGPTVITPILRRIHARHSVETILEAEGIFIDAVGATVAVVALEVLLAPPSQRLSAAAAGIFLRFGVGALVGALGGAAFALLLHFRDALPEGLANVAALASAVAIFELSNAIIPESGITAAIVAGMVVGHARSHELAELREFKGQLTVLLVATLFVLLAANVRLQDVLALGWPGLLTVLCLILVVRPLNVFASTVGTDLEFREKLFLSWLAPRGIVAAAVSSLFAERMTRAGIPGGTAMRALVFLVIACTVVVQGMSAGWVASLLGLRLPRGVGYVILGAHEMARHLGAALRAGGEEVVFIDTDTDATHAAEEQGFKVVLGDGLDERALIKARVQIRRGSIAATANESINFLFAKGAHDYAREVETYVAIERKEAGVSPAMVQQNRSRLLFVGAGDLSHWNGNAARKQVEIQAWCAKADAPNDAPSFEGAPFASVLPLTVSRAQKVTPVERSYVAKEGDVITLAIHSEHGPEVRAWLSEQHFEFVPEADGSPRAAG